MQLIVKDGLEAQRAIIDAVFIVLTLVGHFWHSTKATEALKAIQNIFCTEGTPHPKHRLIQDVST